jgi:hypothetical protein
MRLQPALFLALFALFLAACGDASGTDTDTDTDDTAAIDDRHACEVAKDRAVGVGEGWQPAELAACYAGCADAEASVGYDQGRLACLLDGEFCPRCVGDLGGAGAHYALGYVTCYEQVYTAGYADAGCDAEEARR